MALTRISFYCKIIVFIFTLFIFIIADIFTIFDEVNFYNVNNKLDYSTGISFQAIICKLQVQYLNHYEYSTCITQ